MAELKIPVFLENRACPDTTKADRAKKSCHPRIPDETIRAARHMYEVGMATATQVSHAFPDIDFSYLVRILDRKVRVKVV